MMKLFTQIIKIILQLMHFMDKVTSMPIGVGTIHLLQLFSKLSASVLMSSLILYATQSLHIPDLIAAGVIGTFFALQYFLHVLGGVIGGRYLSYRSLFVIGNILEIAGCLLLTIPNQAFLLWGLTVFACGYGLNISCNCILTQLFKPDDKSREFAFLCNYSIINISFFMGYFIAGYFHLNHAYKTLFILCALSNLTAIAIAFLNWNKLIDRETKYSTLSQSKYKKYILMGFSFIIAIVCLSRMLLAYGKLCNVLICCVTIAMILFIFFLASKQASPIQRNKLYAYLIFSFCTIIIWTIDLIGPIGLTLFTERNVDRHIFGILLATQWIENINNFIPIICGPLLGILFIKLREREIKINIALQFSLALMLIGFSYLLLPIGISYANLNGFSNASWVLSSYALLSIGDVLVGPIGYAMIGLLAPVQLRNMMMGTWMMFGGITSLLASYFSKMMLTSNNITNPLLTNESYSHIFGFLGIGVLVAGGLLFVCIPVISRMTQENVERDGRVRLESILTSNQI